MANIISVFVAIANDKTLRIRVDRESRQQLGLASDFETKMKLGSSVNNFLHHFAELVDFDGKDPAVDIGIFRLGNGFGEGLVYRLYPVAQQILKTQGERKRQTAVLGLRHELHHIDLSFGKGIRAHRDMTLWIDRKIRSAPALHIVKRYR